MKNETTLAQQIVAVLPAGSVVRVLCEDPEMIRFAVQSSDLKLRSVVFSRASLRRLQTDPARDIKVEYLQRDLLRSAIRRAEFRYPRLSELVSSVRARRSRRIGPLALGVAAFSRF